MSAIDFANYLYRKYDKHDTMQKRFDMDEASFLLQQQMLKCKIDNIIREYYLTKNVLSISFGTEYEKEENEECILIITQNGINMIE